MKVKYDRENPNKLHVTLEAETDFDVKYLDAVEAVARCLYP